MGAIKEVKGDCVSVLRLKDVLMLGAVGAYAWSGTVVHQRGSSVDVLPFSAFEAALQDRNHSSLLGTAGSSLLCGTRPHRRFTSCAFLVLKSSLQPGLQLQEVVQ